ncbi:MAG: hypothetical protein MI867_28570, partial [Pseudomonadales bacterium]|nr:hypothetical protein [Pseudomonadales bacterium]
GSVVLTHQHILCFAFSKVLVGLSWEEANIKQLEFTLENGEALSIEYDASLFLEGASGSITLRYKTELADQMMRKIQELTE